MRQAPPLLVLLGGAALIVGGVVGLGSLSFGELLAEAAVPETPADSSPAAEADTPDGGVLHVSGDRTGSLTLSNDDVGFGDNSTPWSSPEGMEASLGWQSDAEVGLYLDHFRLDELDFFLDPGDCTVTAGEIPTTGQVPVSVECPDIGDIRDKAVITLEGVVELPFQFVAPPGIALGGEVTIDGDISATVAVPAPYWVIAPDAAESELPEPEIQIFAESSSGFFSVNLDRDDSGALFVSHLQYNDMNSPPPYFELSPGDCAVTEELVEDTGPASAVYDLTIDCPSLTTSDELPEGWPAGTSATISVQGQFTAHKLVMEPDEG